MAANVTGLHQFANDVGPVPLRRLDDSYTALTIALNTLSTFSNFYSDTGATNALTVQTPATQFVSLTDGLKVLVRVANTNTGAATLNVNGLGAQPILNPNGAEMEPGQLLAGALIEFTYNAVRQAWQVGTSNSNVMTTPFMVMSPDGRLLLAVNPDGSVINAPFTVNNDLGNSVFNVAADGSGHLGDSPNWLEWNTAGQFTMTGAGGAPTLVVYGGAGADQFQVVGAANTTPGIWLALLTANGQTAVGCSNGILVQAGTDAADAALLLQNQTGTENLFRVSGDGSGFLGPPPNQLVWNAAGNFTLTGTATLPFPALHNLTDVLLSGPNPGQVLTYNGAQWVNAGIPNQAFLNSLSLPNPQSGQVLTWDGSGWVAATPGDVTTIALTSLSDVNIVNPFNRQVLTWDTPSARWVNAPAASPYLSTLPDVSIVSPVQSQVLAWDAVDNRWENASLPGGEVIALGALMDVVLAAPAAGQVLAYDASNQRWVNSTLSTTLAGLSDVAVSSPANAQVLTYTSGHWANAVIPAQVFANLAGVTITTPAAGQLLRYQTSPTTAWVNSNTLISPFNVTDPAGGGMLAVTNVGGSPTVTTYASVNDCGLLVTGGANTFTGADWLLRVESSANVATGTSYGVRIRAGTTANDWPFYVQNYNATNTLFNITGAGGVYFPQVPSTAAAANCYISQTTSIAYSSSARRYKRNIRSLTRDRARAIVQALRVVTFNSLCEVDDPKREFFGLVAEEVAPVEPTLADYDKEGKPNGVQYERVLLMLVPLIQELLGLDEPEGESYG